MLSSTALEAAEGGKIPVYAKRYVANEPMHASIRLSHDRSLWIRERLNFAPGRARFEACLSRAFFFIAGFLRGDPRDVEVRRSSASTISVEMKRPDGRAPPDRFSEYS